VASQKGIYYRHLDAKAATLRIRYKAPSGEWKRANVATAGNGRIRQGFALIDGETRL